MKQSVFPFIISFAGFWNLKDAFEMDLIAQPTNHQLDFRWKAGCPPASQEELCNMEVLRERRIGAMSDQDQDDES